MRGVRSAHSGDDPRRLAPHFSHSLRHCGADHHLLVQVGEQLLHLLVFTAVLLITLSEVASAHSYQLRCTFLNHIQ